MDRWLDQLDMYIHHHGLSQSAWPKSNSHRTFRLKFSLHLHYFGIESEKKMKWKNEMYKCIFISVYRLININRYTVTVLSVPWRKWDAKIGFKQTQTHLIAFCSSIQSLLWIVISTRQQEMKKKSSLHMIVFVLLLYQNVDDYWGGSMYNNEHSDLFWLSSYFHAYIFSSHTFIFVIWNIFELRKNEFKLGNNLETIYK